MCTLIFIPLFLICAFFESLADEEPEPPKIYRKRTQRTFI